MQAIHDEALEAARARHEQLQAEWRALRQRLSALGDRVLAVPRSLLEALDRAAAPRAGEGFHPNLRV